MSSIDLGDNPVGSPPTPEQIKQIQEALGLSVPALTEYPVTSPEKAGQKFYYYDIEWHYMTQDQIDATGWTGLVDVGFPAPVDKNRNHLNIYRPTKDQWSSILQFDEFIYSYPVSISADVAIDFVGLNAPHLRERIGNILVPNNSIVVEIRNARLLSAIKDLGTSLAFNLNSKNISAEVIDSLFTQLPPTTNVATIDVRNTTGAATCDPTIATTKGYTVVTS